MAIQSKAGVMEAQEYGGSTTVTGVGFEPEIILFWGWGEDPGEWYNHIRTGFGTWTSLNGSNPGIYLTNYYAGSTTSEVAITRLWNNTSYNYAQGGSSTTSLLRAFHVSATTSDSFTVTYDITSPGFDYTKGINYLALAGDGIEDFSIVEFQNREGSGNVSVTGAGFSPDAVLLVSGGRYGVASNGFTWNGTAAMGFGAFDKDGNQFSAMAVSQNIDGTYAARYFSSQRCLQLNYASGNYGDMLSYVSMDADGFTLYNESYAAWPSYTIALCFKGEVSVGHTNKALSTGNQAITGIGHEPQAGLFISANFQDADTQYGYGSGLSMGATDGSTDVASVFFIERQPQTWAPTDADMTGHNDRLYLKLTSDDQVIEAGAQLASFDSDGFTLYWPETDNINSEIGYILFGSAAPPAVTYDHAATMTGAAAVTALTKARARVASTLTGSSLTSALSKTLALTAATLPGSSGLTSLSKTRARSAVTLPGSSGLTSLSTTRLRTAATLQGGSGVYAGSALTRALSVVAAATGGSLTSALTKVTGRTGTTLTGQAIASALSKARLRAAVTAQGSSSVSAATSLHRRLDAVAAMIGGSSLSALTALTLDVMPMNAIRTTFVLGPEVSEDWNGPAEPLVATGGLITVPGEYGPAWQLAPAGVNYFPNPAANTYSYYGSWSANTSLEWSEDKPDGISVLGSAKRISGGNGASMVCNSYDHQFVEGDPVTVSGWFKHNEPIPRPALFGAVGYNTSGYANWTDRISTPDIPPDTWVWLSYTIPALPAGVSDPRLYCAVTGIGEAGDAIWGTGVQIEKATVPSALITGDSGAGHAWTATPHRSSSTREAANLTFGKAGRWPIERGTMMVRFRPHHEGQNYAFYVGGSTGSRFYIGSQYGGIVAPIADHGGVIPVDPPIVPWEWRRIGATWEEDGTDLHVQIIVDGQIIHTFTTTGDVDGSTQMNIGGFGGHSGDVEGIFIAPDVLTADEIAAVDALEETWTWNGTGALVNTYALAGRAEADALTLMGLTAGADLFGSAAVTALTKAGAVTAGTVTGTSAIAAATKAGYDSAAITEGGSAASVLSRLIMTAGATIAGDADADAFPVLSKSTRVDLNGGSAVSATTRLLAELSGLTIGSSGATAATTLAAVLTGTASGGSAATASTKAALRALMTAAGDGSLTAGTRVLMTAAAVAMGDSDARMWIESATLLMTSVMMQGGSATYGGNRLSSTLTGQTAGGSSAAAETAMIANAAGLAAGDALATAAIRAVMESTAIAEGGSFANALTDIAYLFLVTGLAQGASDLEAMGRLSAEVGGLSMGLSNAEAITRLSAKLAVDMAGSSLLVAILQRPPQVLASIARLQASPPLTVARLPRPRPVTLSDREQHPVPLTAGERTAMVTPIAAARTMNVPLVAGSRGIVPPDIALTRTVEIAPLAVARERISDE